MTKSALDDRLLVMAGVQSYLDQGVPGNILIAGVPECHLVIEPAKSSISVHVKGHGATPDLARYVNLEATTIRWRDSDWLRFTVRTLDRLEDSYPLLNAVLDGVQMDRRSFKDAITTALTAYRNLIAQRTSLSESNQIGLFGELMTLRLLIRSSGAEAATEAWLGYGSEEHDFALGNVDVEVKTTSGEQRSHWISSLSQLEPKAGRALFLLSWMITRAGNARGFTLPDLVQVLCREAGDKAGSIVGHLGEQAFTQDDADLYPTKWALRRNPMIFAVDSSFPALSADRLSRVPQVNLIEKVAYEIDLTSLAPSALLNELGDLNDASEMLL